MQEQLDIELLLTKYTNGVSDSEMAEYIDKLEEAINLCNTASNQGNELVSDAVYDTMVDQLKELKPTSPLLHHVWSENDINTEFNTDLDKYLTKYPMLSIYTVKSLSDGFVAKFKQKMGTTEEVIYSMKLNGHGIRIVVQNGYIKKAATRGRSTNGRDITAIVIMILGAYIPGLSTLEHVELRAEVVLDMGKLGEARKYNPTIKSAFTAVTSLLRESTTPEEAGLLDIIVYDMLTEDIPLPKLSDKFRYLEDAGILVPKYFLTRMSKVNIVQEIERAITEITIHTEDYPYYTDGVVCGLNDLSRFLDFGSEDKFRLGNMALKVGKWKQDMYSGVIESIKWEIGKTKLTPVAVLQGDGELTSTGNRVKNIPLYAPVYILLLEAYRGRVIHFRYGGEAGVIPVTPDGQLVTEITKESGFDLTEFINKSSYVTATTNQQINLAQEQEYKQQETNNDDEDLFWEEDEEEDEDYNEWEEEFTEDEDDED